jgi:hypothetical protein
MPDFDYAADVIVTATGNGYTSMAPTAFSFDNKFTGDEIYSNFGWPDCGSSCTFWSNDPDGFGNVANAAYLTYDASRSVHDGYVKAMFMAYDTSGWSEVAIGAFKVDCTDDSDFLSTCDYSTRVLQTDWSLRDVFIEHSWDLNTAARVDTYHLTMSVGEFAREGSYVIMAYDPNYPSDYVAYGQYKHDLEDLGLYGVEFAQNDGTMVCDSSDSCYSLTEYQFRLVEKKWGTSYEGEGVYASFSASQSTGFDSRFGFRYVIVPGVCPGSYTSVDDCSWNNAAQIEWEIDYMFYDAATQTYEWLWMIPSDVVVGTQYKLLIYGYDHWNTDVSNIGLAAPA